MVRVAQIDYTFQTFVLHRISISFDAVMQHKPIRYMYVNVAHDLYVSQSHTRKMDGYGRLTLL